MEGDLSRCEGIKDISYVNLWPAGDTDMKIQQVKLDELLNKLKNSFAR